MLDTIILFKNKEEIYLNTSVQITLIICITAVILSLINFTDTRLILDKKDRIQRDEDMDIKS